MIAALFLMLGWYLGWISHVKYMKAKGFFKETLDEQEEKIQKP